MNPDPVAGYALPAAVFPADSRIPPMEAAGGSTARAQSQDVLTRAARSAGAIGRSLHNQVIALSDLSANLGGLAAATAAARDALASELAPLVQLADEASCRAAIKAALAGDEDIDDLQTTLDNYVIYDAYFKVIRVPAMTPGQFAAQVAGTCAAVLHDLPFTILAWDEVAAIVDAMAAMFEFLLQGLPDNEAAADAGVPSIAAPAWDASIGAAIAVYRWTVGHHFFDLCSIFLRDCLSRARAAVKKDDVATTTLALHQARVHLRAVPAAMWYTSNFPMALYLDPLRPSMERQPTHGGFSGTQNADHNRMKDEKERLIEDLFDRYGDDPAGWPPEVYRGLTTFHEIDTRGAEQHILVAASKVDLDASLAQKIAQTQGQPSENAVDALRAVAEATRHDLSERFRPAARRIHVARRQDVQREHPLCVQADGRQILLCQVLGQFWATDTVCTHEGANLCEGHVAEDGIVCPLHGAKFDPRTGAVLRGPATKPLATYRLVEDGDDLLLEI